MKTCRGKRDYGYPRADTLPAEVEPLPRAMSHMGGPGPGRKPDQPDVLGFVPLRFNFETVKKVVQGALESPQSLTTLLRHPVEHFWGLWHDADVTQVRTCPYI